MGSQSIHGSTSLDRLAQTSRVILWAAMSIALVTYLFVDTVPVRLSRTLTIERDGIPGDRHVRYVSEPISRFFSVDRSVRSIWAAFREALPEVGNNTLLIAVYWLAIGTFCAGVLLLLWIALTPGDDEPASVAPPVNAYDVAVPESPAETQQHGVSVPV